MAKTVIITGSSTGIGLAAAKLFHEKGWNVVATMRNPESEGGLELSKLPSVLVTKLDVQDAQSIKHTVETAIVKFKRVDLLVNNAGYGQMGLLEAVSREKILEQFNVNVFGVIDTIKEVLPHMRNNEPIDGSRGTILNVGSGTGKFAMPLASIYCASKHALDGLTEALSYELASQKINTKFVIPHSAVTSTNFNSRSGASFAFDLSLASYNDFSATVGGKYARVYDVKLTSTDVAQLIYDAATDSDTARLRYYIGDDPADLLGKKQKLSEEEFMKFINTTFTS